MGIKVIKASDLTCDKPCLEPAGFLHKIPILVCADGSTNPTSFTLGNFGDQGVTTLVFDTRKLKPMTWNTETYMPKIAAYDVTTGESLGTDFELTREKNKYLFTIPNEWTTSNHEYKIIFALIEGEVDGNGNTEYTEIFVSDEIVATAPAETMMSGVTEGMLVNASVTGDDLKDLVKSHLNIIPSRDHYTVHVNSENAGNKFDQYMKRIVLDNFMSAELEEGLDYRYMIFKKGTSIYVNRMKSIHAGLYDVCWVPLDVSIVAGEYDVFIVAQNEEASTSGYTIDFKRWVSNSFKIMIKDNFLTQGFNPHGDARPYYCITTTTTPPVTGGVKLTSSQVFGNNAPGVDITMEERTGYIWILNPILGKTLQGYTVMFGWGDLDNVVSQEVQFIPEGQTEPMTYFGYRTEKMTAGDYKIRLTKD